LIRSQKRCNFCGSSLSHPKSFKLAVKCKQCALKNSAIILPTRLLCNLCMDRSSSYLVRSKHCKNPLKFLGNTESLQSSDLIKQVWQNITDTIIMFCEQLEKEDQLPKEKSEFFLASYNSHPEKGNIVSDYRGLRVTSCLSKVKDIRTMHCHVLLYLICRMLKVFRFLLFHELYPEKECVIAFR
jgi:hypothetical protein